MRDLRATASAVGYDVAVGAGIGLIVLGVGGRVAMHLFGLASGTAGGWTLGGTATVVALGAASGAAGALLLAFSRDVAGRVARESPAAEARACRALFAMLLFLATLRGLQGSPRNSLAYFLPLVAVYGVAMERASSRYGPSPGAKSAL